MCCFSCRSHSITSVLLWRFLSCAVRHNFPADLRNWNNFNFLVQDFQFITYDCPAAQSALLHRHTTLFCPKPSFLRQLEEATSEAKSVSVIRALQLHRQDRSCFRSRLSVLRWFSIAFPRRNNSESYLLLFPFCLISKSLNTECEKCVLKQLIWLPQR